MDPDKNQIAEEVREAVTGGLDDDWHLIAVELRNFRADHAPATSASMHKEFILAADRVSISFKRRFTKFLELCRDRHVRPDEVIEPTANALRELIQKLRSYGEKRIACSAGFGKDKLVSALHEEAIAFAEQSLTQACFLALQGIAGSTVIFERAGWPPKEETGVQDVVDTAEIRDAELNASGASESNTSDQPRPTAASHRKATEFLARWLKFNEHATKREALDILRQAGIPVSATGFNQRVWPQARESASLTRKAPPGQKSRRSEATKKN